MNAEEPSLPCTALRGGYAHDFIGLTKREHAAILLRVPDSGDDVIDAMIRKANRRDAAVAVLQGLMANDPVKGANFSVDADFSTQQAECLLAHLERTA